MSCSNPMELRYEDLKPPKFNSRHINHADFKSNALRASMNTRDYYYIPCRSCTNCRIDRANEIIDRCEYEYMTYGSGAFVTLTYDDVHIHKNSFIDSETGEYVSSINYKDGKDFLNRLNKLVHKEYKRVKKETGIRSNPLINPDYKYVITYEYGDQNGRPHIHCLFFGLDFAICERLFWRAWCFQGNVEVGPIKNGGIAYCVKYIRDQEFGLLKRFKYTYRHLEPPKSTHSLGLGEGLYTSQLSYIKITGTYRWHGKDKPVPSYYKNKYLIISDLKADKVAERFRSGVNDAYNLYNIKPKTFQELWEHKLAVSRCREQNLEESLMQHGKKVLDPALLRRQIHKLFTDDKHRIPDKYDNCLFKIRKPDGTFYVQIGQEKFYDHLTPSWLYSHNLDFSKLKRLVGDDDAYLLMCQVNPNSPEEQARLALF